MRKLKKKGKENFHYNPAEEAGAGRHNVLEGKNKDGQPSGPFPSRTGKKRVPREGFYETTRINSGKWEKFAGIGGSKSISIPFFVLLSGYVGRLTVFGQALKNCFFKQRPKKSRFLQTIAILGIVFEELSS